MSALVEKLAPDTSGTDTAPAWLDALRRTARRHLMQAGFPGRKTEDWKYTSLKLVEKRALDRPGSGPVDAMPAWTDDACVLRCVNGRLEIPDGLPAGVTVRPLADFEAAPEGLNVDPGGREAAFAWLNLMFLESAWVIDVADTVDVPLVWIHQTSDDFAGAVHPRVVLRVHAGASLNWVEHVHTAGEGLVNLVNDISLASGACLDHVRLQDCGDNALLVARSDARLAGGARYYWTGADLGARLDRLDLNVALDAPGAECRINGVMLAAGRAHVDWHTRIDHNVGPTTSNETVRGIVDGRGHGVFNGKIIVHPGADGSASEMNNANLLLSGHAEMDTKPELEIYADEVTAAHGATVGQLDETALFYLRSRGVPADQAAALLKAGFARAPLEVIAHAEIRERFVARVNEALA